MNNKTTNDKEQTNMGTKKEQRITYVFYRDWSEIIETMPPEMELQVRRAIDAYAFNNEVVELPLEAKYFFEAIKKDIDRDKEKWNDIKEKRADAGKNGNIKRWGNKHKVANIANATSESQTSQEVANVANVAVNVDVNGLKGDKHPMENKKTSLSKESEVKKEPQSGNALAPSLEDVKDYILSHGFDVDAEYFYSVNEAKGWVTNGGAPIKNWKAQVWVWTRNGIGNKSKGSDAQRAAPQAQRTSQGYSSKGIEETKKMLYRIAKEEKKAISHKEWLAQQNKGTK